MIQKYLLLLSLFIVAACNARQNETTAEYTESTAQEASIAYPDKLNSLTQAHQLTKFHQQEVIAFDIELYFRGNSRLAGTIYSRTNSTAVLVDKSDGTKLLYDGKEVYITPDTTSMKGARFDALTWSYFALAPFKFKDNGTRWTENGLLPLDSGQADYSTMKLTFGDNVGDAPDDWYLIFQEEQSHLLKAMAYIVTFGDTPQEEAAKSPHAITYSDYIRVDGIPFASSWKFYNWDAKVGLGSQLGDAKLTNIRFMAETDSLFAKTEQAQLVPLK